MKLHIRPGAPLRGEVSLPGDKSITHRALLLGALSEGATRIRGYLDSGDCRATVGCLRTLGVRVERRAQGELVVHGKGLRGWREPVEVLDCQRSGTTMRLLAGLLAGQPLFAVLGGHAQLLGRPMERITRPLRAMGAHIDGRDGGRLAPLAIRGGGLKGCEHRLAVASAQVKSSLLLAGLYAEGDTTVIEPGPSRDHTERMLAARGARLCSAGLRHTIVGPAERLAALDTEVPGDFSSAAYLIAAALLAPGSELLLRHVGVNPTRTGLLDVIEAMGAGIERLDPREQGGEPVADLLVRPQPLKGIEVAGEVVPRMIDEFPILAVLATQAQGRTVVRGAAELRLKESDRISELTAALTAMGAHVQPAADGFAIEGPTPLRGASLSPHGDHRLAMALAVAGLVAEGETVIDEAERIADSFPGFAERLEALRGRA